MMASSRAWTLALTHRSWFSWRRSCGVYWFCKNSTIVMALTTGLYFRLKRPWMAVGALSSSLFVRDFAMGHIAWGATSVFASFVSHRTSASFRGMRLIAFETQFTAVLHVGSLVSCHNFLIIFIYFNNRSRPGRSLFNSDKVIIPFDSRYAEVTEAVKARPNLSASTQELISIVGDIKLEVRLWNRSQSVTI
jgi:hypothetical protein